MPPGDCAAAGDVAGKESHGHDVDEHAQRRRSTRSPCAAAATRPARADGSRVPSSLRLLAREPLVGERKSRPAHQMRQRDRERSFVRRRDRARASSARFSPMSRLQALARGRVGQGEGRLPSRRRSPPCGASRARAPTRRAPRARTIARSSSAGGRRRKPPNEPRSAPRRATSTRRAR